MKKLISMALATAAIFTANAADITVYNNGTLAEGVAYNGWWNVAYDGQTANPDGEGYVFSFKSADGGADASMGFIANSESFYTGPLNTATLNFNWYAQGTGKYTVRLTAGAVEQDYNFTVDATNAGKWNTTSLSVPENFANVAKAWKEFANDGAGFIFGIVVSEGSADAVMYFDNIYYSNIDEEWKAPEVEVFEAPKTVPVPEKDAADVVSLLSGKYTPAVEFGIGSWGQSTIAELMTIDNAPVYYLRRFNYLGWEFRNPATVDVSDCDYVHVDYYTPNGTTFGFTPISAGQEKGWNAPAVKQNEWNSYDVPLSYFSNVNFAAVFQMKFDQGNSSEGYIANVYFYKSGNTPVDPIDPTDAITYKGEVKSTVSQTMGDETKEYPYTLEYAVTYNTDRTLTIKAEYIWANGEPVGMVAGSVFVNNGLNDFALENGVRTVTTTEKFVSGDLIPLNFYIPMALGVVETPIQYEVGSTSNGTGIDFNVVDADAPVEYFNLQGVRIANPENGVYIRRQGSKVSKVFVR